MTAKTQTAKTQTAKTLTIESRPVTFSVLTGNEGRISALELIGTLDKANRLGADWLRTGLAEIIGKPIDRSNASTVNKECDDAIEKLARELARAFVSRGGIAHESAAEPMRIAFRNAFPALKGVTVRVKSDASKPLEPTKAYSGCRFVSETRQRDTDRMAACLIAWKWADVGRDVSDPTEILEVIPGSPEAGAAHGALVGDLPAPLPEGMERGGSAGVRYTPEGVEQLMREQESRIRRESFKTIKALRCKVRGLYLELSDARSAIDRLETEAKAKTKATPKRRK